MKIKSLNNIYTAIKGATCLLLLIQCSAQTAYAQYYANPQMNADSAAPQITNSQQLNLMRTPQLATNPQISSSSTTIDLSRLSGGASSLPKICPIYRIQQSYTQAVIGVIIDGYFSIPSTQSCPSCRAQFGNNPITSQQNFSNYCH